jgi:hypothetical protein
MNNHGREKKVGNGFECEKKEFYHLCIKFIRKKNSRDDKILGNFKNFKK